MNKKTTFKLCMLFNILSIPICAAEQSWYEKIGEFKRNYIRKATCIGTCTGEEDLAALRKMRTAERLVCAGACSCAASGYGAVACVENLAETFILGSISGCGGSLALHQAGNLSQLAHQAAFQRQHVLYQPHLVTPPSQQIMGITPSRPSRVLQLSSPSLKVVNPLNISATPSQQQIIGMDSRSTTGSDSSPTSSI